MLCWCICQSEPYFVFVFRLFLRSTVFVLDTGIFLGNYFLLILSYLDTKDVPLGRFAANGIGRQRSTTFSLIFFFFFYHQSFFLIQAIPPHIELVQQQMLEFLFKILFLFPLLFLYFLFPPIYHSSFFTDCFPLILINHQQFD